MDIQLLCNYLTQGEKPIRAVYKTSLSIFVALFLISGVTYAASSAKDTFYNGVVHAVQGKFKKAKVEFERTLKINPDYSRAKYGLATIDDVLAGKIKAQTAIYIFKGVSYNNKVLYSQAIRVLTRAIKLNSKYAWAFFNRGVAYYDKGQFDRAIADYNRAIEIDPKYAKAYSNRGYAYFIELDNKVKGCTDYQKACELGECRNYDYVKNTGLCR